MAVCSRSLTLPVRSSGVCLPRHSQNPPQSALSEPGFATSCANGRRQPDAVRLFPLSSKATNRTRSPSTSKFGSLENIALADRVVLRNECRRGERFACRALEEERGGGGEKKADEGPPYEILSMLALWAFWAGLAYYAFAFAPNQTPIRDEYFLGKLTLLTQDEYPINQVLLSEFLLMGIWPAIYTALLIPSGRSKDFRPPVWPFASLSLGIGIGGLLPYFALWRQPAPPPPSQEERRKLPILVSESKITAGVLLAGCLGLVGAAVASGPSSYIGFYQYFQESKFVHVMTLDFCCLTLFCPFWLYNDMEYRNWSGRNIWFVPLSLLPILGPALYLFIRPPLPEPVSSNKQVAEAPKPIG